MPYRAVLFDVGGPIDTEVSAEASIDERIKAMVRAVGVEVTEERYAEAARWAVERFAPSTYAAIVWRLCGGDERLAARVGPISFPERPFELREGVAELIEDLHSRNVLLGLAANQPARTLETLDQLAIGRYFQHREMSGHHGFRKPDVRLFLRACDDLGVAPAETIMVGDRIDNDIAPARLLGMYTIVFRTGRHIQQQPRGLDEVPHAEVWDVVRLRGAILERIELPQAR